MIRQGMDWWNGTTSLAENLCQKFKKHQKLKPTKNIKKSKNLSSLTLPRNQPSRHLLVQSQQ